MKTEATIAGLLAAGEAGRVALADCNGVEVTYEELRRQIGQTQRWLAGFGIRKSDVVAVALKNHPRTALVYLALASYCRVAPLNPAYRVGEVDFALRDIGARALVTTQDLPEAAAAAQACGAGLMWMRPGTYELEAGPGLSTAPSAELPARPGPDDIALLLHTSGTTARPKQVALTHRNLCLSTNGVLEVLQLTPVDNGLLLMPLYHVHGLVAGLLASIAAGSTVYCPPGFQATSFFSWLDSSQATWYTAVPTMHQAILARAPRNEAIVARHKLRLIRSASSMLHPSVLHGLEEVFGVPVLNAYGMTEAAHQIGSTRLPGLGGAASRTSVGYASGPSVAVLNGKNEMAAPGETGEVVLCGDQIIGSYLAPSSANDTAFHDGWFRTGDEGYLDPDGALTLTGRLKEIINSGGEKISPLEVEEALLAERSVHQAVVFAVPHPLLGEAVGAAVVLHEGAELMSERELLDAIGRRLARHKLPRSILLVDEIPVGATGKVQRIGMAERLKNSRAAAARVLTS